MRLKKHLFLSVIVLILACRLQGQTYIFQSFEGFFPPEYWILAWEPGSNNWARTAANAYDGNYSAFHNDYLSLQQAWVITPQLDLSDADYPVLHYMDAVVNRQLADAHRVMVSTDYNGTGNPILFTWDTLVEMIGTTEWEFAANIPLSAYKTDNVYVAWEYYGLDASEWYIDSVLIEEGIYPPPNDLCVNAHTIGSPYPDTIFGTNKGATFDCTQSLLFHNGVWYSIELPYACNIVEITVRALEYNLRAFSKVLTTDCGCDPASIIQADAWSFTSDTSATMSFLELTGPGIVYLPLEVTKFQDFCLEVDVIGCCQEPSNLDAENASPTSTWLSWDENGASVSWELEYGLYGFVPDWIPEDTAYDNPFLLTGLAPASCYEFYVRSICVPSGYSNWVGPFMFCTACPDAFSDYQYLANFEAPVWPPPCWTVQSSADSTWRAATTTVDPLTRTAYVNSQPGVNQDEWLISPTFDLSEVGNPQLGFDWITDYSDMVTFDYGDLGLYISSNAGLTWGAGIPIWTEESDGQFTPWRWSYKQLDLTAYAGQPAVRFAFRYSGNGAEAFGLDNFMIGPPNDSTQWSGHENQFWFHLGNWTNDVPFSGSCTCVPNVSPAGDPLPTLNNAAQCLDLYVAPGAYLNLLGGTTLIVTNQEMPPALLPGDAQLPDSKIFASPYLKKAVAEGSKRIKSKDHQPELLFSPVVYNPSWYKPVRECED